ncbi:hypothetical protein PF004_g20372 [Phytophthora fragariae]|uniref:Uncharacterized protein n=1 Tax=Phytophthora fragariae TaxID=53985 RepID=A0A6G0N7P5_9STRA|nr:hypothetical protein PF004_g20372 [Phytophthora fragariae]
MALRLARSPEQSNEPYAWASRVHLRRLCVGKHARTGYGKGKTPEQSRDGACVDMEKMLLQEHVAISEKKCMYADADAESNATVQWHGADTAALVSE